MNGEYDGKLEIAKARQRTDGGDVLVVEVSGDIDLAAADRFAAELGERDGAHVRAVVIDLAAVRFIDSSGIRVLLEADRELCEAGDSCGIVVGEGSPVARALELAAVLDTVTTFPTRDRAIAELTG